MKLKIQVVTDLKQFVALRDAWRRLWIDSGGYIFQSHDWITGWLVGLQGRRDARLLTVLAWDGDRLAGVIPGAVHRRRGYRVVHFAAQIFSDYCDCLIGPDYDPDVVLPLLWDGLDRAGGFDVIRLRQIPADARCLRFFSSLARAGNACMIEPQERCLRIDNQWANGALFFRSLSKKGRNNHTRGKRILTELGGDVSFRVIEPDEPADAIIYEILRLKEAWLRVNDPRSLLFGHDRVVFRTILDSAWRSGLAKVFILQCNGRIAAASINFVYGNRMEAYFTSYDEAFERASPGTILIVEYSKWAFDHGLKLVDFLRGEEAFKLRLVNAETPLSSVTVPRTLVGHLAILGYRHLPWRQRRRQVADEPRAPAIVGNPVTGRAS